MTRHTPAEEGLTAEDMAACADELRPEGMNAYHAYAAMMAAQFQQPWGQGVGIPGMPFPPRGPIVPMNGHAFKPPVEAANCARRCGASYEPEGEGAVVEYPTQKS